MDHLKGLAKKFQDRVAFLFIYISEPQHAIPELGPYAVGGLLDKSSSASHSMRILKGMEIFDLPFRCLLDDGVERVETDYGAFPQRLIVVGINGAIMYDSGCMPKRWDMLLVEKHLNSALSKSAR